MIMIVVFVSRGGPGHFVGGVQDQLWSDPPEHIPVTGRQRSYPGEYGGGVAQGEG